MSNPTGIDRIGFTTDGKVFIVINGEVEKRPIQTITMFDPDYARKVAASLLDAAERAPK